MLSDYAQGLPNPGLFNAMRKRTRVSMFTMVGVVATAIHYTILYILTALGMQIAAANMVAFWGAISFSFTFQQRVSFRDRLKETHFNLLAFMIVVSVNTLISYLGGLTAMRFSVLKAFLPLFAAGINLLLYWSMSSASFLKSPRVGGPRH